MESSLPDVTATTTMIRMATSKRVAPRTIPIWTFLENLDHQRGGQYRVVVVIVFQLPERNISEWK